MGISGKVSSAVRGQRTSFHNRFENRPASVTVNATPSDVTSYRWLARPDSVGTLDGLSRLSPDVCSR
jgi:hypothetical protein